MKKQDKLYDVYVSYPPDVDRERINACLYDNLPEKEAEDLVQALAERPQAIIAENCTQDERENAQQYFNYLGLDVIVRQSNWSWISAAKNRKKRLLKSASVPYV